MTPWSDPRSYRPDPAELLRRSGFRRTLVDDFSDFIADIRGNPSLSATVFGLGIAFGLLATVGIAYVISWVVA